MTTILSKAALKRVAVNLQIHIKSNGALSFDAVVAQLRAEGSEKPTRSLKHLVAGLHDNGYPALGVAVSICIASEFAYRFEKHDALRRALREMIEDD